MWKRLLFTVYMILLVSIVWLLPGDKQSYIVINLYPLHTIKLYISALLHGYAPWYVIFSNLIGNIVLFIPLGMVLYQYLFHIGFIKLFIVSLLVPICIEGVQLLLYLLGYGARTIDIDDVLLNMIGIWIGYWMTCVAQIERSDEA